MSKQTANKTTRKTNKAVTGFAGFGATTQRFLKDLAANNNRPWFIENKNRYESDVLGPALDFIVAMAPRIEKISDQFEAIAKKQGGSLMRVYRDTRFGGDKTPYKTNIGIQFRHHQGKDVHAPGFYVHIEPGACFLGAGMWRPEPEPLQQIRQRLIEKPEEWKKAIANKSFTSHWSLGGESLKKPPRGFAADHPLIEDLKRKDFIAGRDLADKAVSNPAFLDLAAEHFLAAKPLMNFLCKAMGLA